MRRKAEFERRNVDAWRLHQKNCVYKLFLILIIFGQNKLFKNRVFKIS